MRNTAMAMMLNAHPAGPGAAFGTHTGCDVFAARRGEAKTTANVYFDGLSVPKDYKRAFELYQQAHAVGCSKATSQLACMCLNGLVLPMDYKRALELYHTEDWGKELACRRH